MLTVQSPATGNHLARPKTGRRPLQPIRSPTNLPPPPINNSFQKPHLKHGSIEISEDSNKENPNPNPNPIQNDKVNHTSILISDVAAAPVQIEQFEVSLADELSAIRKKMERLRADKERTEKMLREREIMMEMKELDRRGEIQKVLEIEVDRLYRLNELRSLCNRILPIRSLREKEQEKIKPDKLKVEEGEEKKGQDSL
ncbi:hypothetical protein L1987_03641 [Smallanthus sonchifolius]|uniref:Uncharacterized protein n=1 Tax=Smallanthus sonchifolius TaxID=185202 RepID=A0ACB9KB30_9ASTR|nr:hypothetical protein L1987_03641 [Smallanthus sonchifolius]